MGDEDGTQVSVLHHLSCHGVEMLTVNTSPVLASDYGPMVREILGEFVILCGVSVILGTMTAGALVWFSRRKWVWFLIPVFGICWFAVILGLHEAWGNITYSPGSGSREPTIPIPGPAPEEVP